MTFEKLRRYLARRAKAPAIPVRLTCAGGPFHLESIWVSTFETARFRVGEYHGHYKQSGRTANWIKS